MLIYDFFFEGIFMILLTSDGSYILMSII